MDAWMGVKASCVYYKVEGFFIIYKLRPSNLNINSKY